VERKHPCLRGGGSCRKGEDCDYVTFPYEACLPYLQGKCPRSPCPDLHMDEVPPPSLLPASPRRSKALAPLTHQSPLTCLGGHTGPGNALLWLLLSPLLICGMNPMPTAVAQERDGHRGLISYGPPRRPSILHGIPPVAFPPVAPRNSARANVLYALSHSPQGLRSDGKLAWHGTVTCRSSPHRSPDASLASHPDFQFWIPLHRRTPLPSPPQAAVLDAKRERFLRRNRRQSFNDESLTLTGGPPASSSLESLENPHRLFETETAPRSKRNTVKYIYTKSMQESSAPPRLERIQGGGGGVFGGRGSPITWHRPLTRQTAMATH